MRLDDECYTELEILSFNSRCKLDEMSYEQTVDVRTSDGAIVRLLDFMGFSVNESRLGKNKKVVLCVPYIDGEITLLEAGFPCLLENDFDPEGEAPSRLTFIAKVQEANRDDHDLLVDVGFGTIYVLPDHDKFDFKTGDIIRFKAGRLDLLEILE